MAKSTTQTWALFKAMRVLVFSLATIFSMGFAAIYAVLLIRGWSSYSNEQRCVVIVALSTYAVSSIILYLMLILRFRLWFDGVRIALIVFCQVGGTVTFIIFRPNLPCNNLGSPSTCQAVETIVTYGGLGLAGLLLLFAFYLAYMSYVPVPPPRPNPEAILALKLSNDYTSEKEKKGLKRASDSSLGSSTSSYSQSSQSSFVSPRPSATPSTMAFASRTPSMVSARAPYNNINDNYYRSAATPRPGQALSPNLPPRMRALQLPAMAARAPSAQGAGPPLYGPDQQYRSITPGAPSVRSMAPSTVSNLNIRPSTRQRYYNSNGLPAPVPVLPQSQYLMPSTMMTGESISRQGTPMSMMSNQSGSSYYPPRQQQRGPSAADHLSPPPGLAYSNPGQFPQPPGVSSPYTRNLNTGAPSRVTSPSPLGQMHTIAEDGHGMTMGGPVNGMQMQMREAPMYRTPSPSPTPPPEVMNRVPSPNFRSLSPSQTEKPRDIASMQHQQPQVQPQQMPQQKRYQLQDRPLRQQKLRQEIQQLQHSPPSRRSSVSSVPRSPSPQHDFFSPSDNLPLPITPMSAVLPAHPTLPPRSATPTITSSSSSSSGSSRNALAYGGYSHESSPTVRLNDRPSPASEDDKVDVNVVGFWRQNTPRPLRLVGKPPIEP